MIIKIERKPIWVSPDAIFQRGGDHHRRRVDAAANLARVAANRQSNPVLPAGADRAAGNHPGSFEHAHQLGRDGKTFDFGSVPAVEEFDLVVVGAGISGLAAACFWQQLKASSSAFC